MWTLQPLSKSQKALLETAATAYQKQLTPELTAYLEERGFSAETIKHARFGQVSEPLVGSEYLQGRLAIPYIGPTGNVYNLRFRCTAHADCKAEGCDSKYMSLPGYPSRVYNVRSLVSADTSIDVTEGELDAVTLEQCGLYAIGIPGVDSLPAHFARLVAGFSDVRVWIDGDKAGREFAKRFLHAVPSARACTVEEGEDVNSVYVAKGAEGVLALREG